MITLTAYKGKKVAVFGLGKAGDASVRALMAGGARVFAWDDNEQSRHNLMLAFKDDNFLMISPERWNWSELACMVLSPGIALTHNPHPTVAKAQAAGVKILGDIELLYAAQPDARYVAITGTNGKSTTTTLIAHLLEAEGGRVEVGGNLGTAALSLQPLGKGETYVLELSSYQLDLVHSTRFNIACLLNVTVDHLDRHGTIEEYAQVKAKIFDRQQKSDVAVVAVDDDYTRAAAEALKARDAKLVKVSAGHALTDGVSVEQGILREMQCGKALFECDLKDIVTLTGRHNWQNAAVAYAAARACGLSAASIAEQLKTFPGLAHRMELVAEINGVRYINDSKATNADAVSNALAPYDTIYWILGGKPKSGGIESLKEFFPQIAHAFLIGQAEDAFAATLEGQVPYTRCGALANAFRAASDMAQKDRKSGAVVLLSPACASWDQWKSFEERGDAFRVMVNKLS